MDRFHIGAECDGGRARRLNTRAGNTRDRDRFRAGALLVARNVTDVRRRVLLALAHSRGPVGAREDRRLCTARLYAGRREIGDEAIRIGLAATPDGARRHRHGFAFARRGDRSGLGLGLGRRGCLGGFARDERRSRRHARRGARARDHHQCDPAHASIIRLHRSVGASVHRAAHRPSWQTASASSTGGRQSTASQCSLGHRRGHVCRGHASKAARESASGRRPQQSGQHSGGVAMTHSSSRVHALCAEPTSVRSTTSGSGAGGTSRVSGSGGTSRTSATSALEPGSLARAGTGACTDARTGSAGADCPPQQHKATTSSAARMSASSYLHERRYVRNARFE